MFLLENPDKVTLGAQEVFGGIAKNLTNPLPTMSNESLHQPEMALLGHLHEAHHDKTTARLGI